MTSRLRASRLLSYLFAEPGSAIRRCMRAFTLSGSRRLPRPWSFVVSDEATTRSYAGHQRLVAEPCHLCGVVLVARPDLRVQHPRAQEEFRLRWAGHQGRHGDSAVPLLFSQSQGKRPHEGLGRVVDGLVGPRRCIVSRVTQTESLATFLGHVRTVETGSRFARASDPQHRWRVAGGRDALPELSQLSADPLPARSTTVAQHLPALLGASGRRALPVCLCPAAAPKKAEHAAPSGARHGHRDSARPLVAATGDVGIPHHGAGGCGGPLRGPR